MNARRMQCPEQARCGCWNCLCVRGSSLASEETFRPSSERIPGVFPKEAHLLQVQVRFPRQRLMESIAYEL